MLTVTSDPITALEHQWTLLNLSPELRDELLEKWVTSCAKISDDGGKTFSMAFVLHLRSEDHRQTIEADEIFKKIYKEIVSRTDIDSLVVSSPSLQCLLWMREDLAS